MNFQRVPGIGRSLGLDHVPAVKKVFTLQFYLIIMHLYFLTDRCSLVCRSGSSIYWLGTTIDGTRCSNQKENLDVCIEGHCKVCCISSL